jgi:two-component sensor histidine kinase
VPFAEIPTVIAEVIGRQLAGIRALSAAGVELYQDELTALAEIAKIVSSIATAHKKLTEEKPLDQLTEAEIKAALTK